ncbi:hypothetical protein BASA81_005692 [Batrachochytrium salamandrivorans]|nr:hypothetical protein BASA81_005692 [Batrachochytrium salamandrivorans]
MDLDATRRGPITPQERDRRFQGKLCFRCGKEGHFRAECPLTRRQVSAVSTLTEFPTLTPVFGKRPQPIRDAGPLLTKKPRPPAKPPKNGDRVQMLAHPKVNPQEPPMNPRTPMRPQKVPRSK